MCYNAPYHTLSTLKPAGSISIELRIYSRAVFLGSEGHPSELTGNFLQKFSDLRAYLISAGGAGGESQACVGFKKGQQIIPIHSLG